MKKIGLGIDYSNICKDYNTAYLDRDNDDRETKKCMKEVLVWTKELLSAYLEHFGCTIYRFNDSAPVDVDEVASKRFLFYSLEKEITLQKYVLSKSYAHYETLAAWESESRDCVLIQNDENGGAIYLFFNEGSPEHQWIRERLKEFTLDDVPFQAK